MKVALIPCGTTEWRREGRLLGRVELSLTPAGHEQCARWVEQLRTALLERIFHSPDELATQTADLLGMRLGVPTKSVDGLTEVDLGLWAGLTEQQLKKRFASAHRQLCESPLNVSPPAGESFSAAAARVRACLKKRVKPNGKQTVGLVMRPFSLAMARVALEGSEDSQIWETAQVVNEPLVVDSDRVPARAGEA